MTDAPGSSRTCKACGESRAYPDDFYDKRRTCKACIRAERTAETQSLTPGQRASRSARSLRWRYANVEKARAQSRASMERERLRDPDGYRARQNIAQRKSSARKRALLAAAKDVPCADCGIKYPPAAMDFDHRDPAEKEYTPSQMLGKTDAAILAEIAKCDVRCANCHRIRHHEQRQAAQRPVA